MTVPTEKERKLGIASCKGYLAEFLPTRRTCWGPHLVKVISLDQANKGSVSATVQDHSASIRTYELSRTFTCVAAVLARTPASNAHNIDQQVVSRGQTHLDSHARSCDVQPLREVRRPHRRAQPSTRPV